MEAENPTSMQAMFGPYVVDLRSGELRKHGTKLKLGEQPLQILILLLQREGGLVTRDELQTRLWANHTFVDFDRSLNSAVQRLRDSLSDRAEKARWIETVPRRGYRFAGQVDWSDQCASRSVPPELPGGRETPVDCAPPALGIEFPPAADHTTAAGMELQGELVKSPRASGILRYVLPFLAFVAIAVTLLLVFERSPLRRRTSGRALKAHHIQSLAVLPLKNLSRDPEQGYFSDGMTDELITELAKFRTLRVISHTSVERYKETKQPLPEIAHELGVDAVVEGTVLRVGDRVRITVQLIDAGADRHLWADSYERDSRDVLGLQDEVARQIAAAVGINLAYGGASEADHSQ